MPRDTPELTSLSQDAVEARAQRQHAYRAHAFTCEICCENEEALCPEGHRLLVEALKPVELPH